MSFKKDFEPGDQYDDDYIVCPHCGYQRLADFEDNSEDVFDDECEECGKEFVHWAQISISYVIRKRKDCQ
jgi:DNA-directed RNA polymerase subunit RPC12/RpoP